MQLKKSASTVKQVTLEAKTVEAGAWKPALLMLIQSSDYMASLLKLFKLLV